MAFRRCSSTPPTEVNVTGGVLAGNATAHVINTGGTTTLNLLDPDSLIFGPKNQLVLDSQSDQQLVFISHPGSNAQSVSVLNLTTTVDDTVFAKGGQQPLLFSDRSSGKIYELTGKFGAGQAISAADSANLIAALDLKSGELTPLVSGLDSPHGEAFLNEPTSGVPELGTWAMMQLGFGLVAIRLRHRDEKAPTNAA
jgi:hypothetical protein